MTHRSTLRLVMRRIGQCVLASGAFTASLLSAQARLGLFGTPLGAAYTTPLTCFERTNFVVGLIEHQTDRIVGVQLSCVKIDPDRGWDAQSLVTAPGLGDQRSGTATSKLCPQDYVLIGFNAVTGTYSADSHGMAQAKPAPMIADLAPVCRNRQNMIYALPRGALSQADDNHLQAIPWDGAAGPRSCPAGFGVSAIAFVFDKTRNIDPADPFRDVALTCRRLPITMSARAHAP